MDSNQLVTSSLLADLNYFLETKHQLIDNYRASYTAGNTSLEAVANGIPYDVITANAGTKKVRFYWLTTIRVSICVLVCPLFIRHNCRYGALYY